MELDPQIEFVWARVGQKRSNAANMGRYIIYIVYERLRIQSM